MMPPHTNSAPTRDGHVVVLEGYSLNYTNPAEELVITDAETGEVIPFEAGLATVTEDRSRGAEDPPPGSLQIRCVLTVRLQRTQDRPVTVAFLGDEWTL